MDFPPVRDKVGGFALRRTGNEFVGNSKRTLKVPNRVIPSKRFRLFVAANITDVNTQMASDFALAALNQGMVYFCSWGPDCERFHDIVDEVVVEDDIGEQKFAKNCADWRDLFAWAAYC